MPAFSPWTSSGLLGGTGRRIAIASGVSAMLWLAVAWSSLDLAPPLAPAPSGTSASQASDARPLPAPPALHAVAVAGAAATGGGSYDRFGLESQTIAAPVNARGDVALFAKLMRTAADEGLFLSRAAGRTQLVANVGGTVPGGGTLTSFTERPVPALNDSGTVAFAATVEGGRASDMILSWTDGKLTSVVQSGTRTPGIAGGAFFDFGPPQINAAGDVAFLSTVRRGRETLDAIYLSAKGQLTKVAAAGDPAPGGGAFAALALPALNASDAVAFAAVLEGGPAQGGIFVAAGGAIRRAVAVGDPAPGGGMFTRLAEHVGIDDRGRLAFAAFLGQGAPRIGVFLAEQANVVPVALLGAAAPGGGKFVSFGDAVALASDGGLAFVGSVEGGPGTSGVYAYGPAGLTRVGGVGDAIAAGKRIAYFPLNTAIAAGPGGRVTFHAGLQSGEQQSDAILVHGGAGGR